MGWLGELINTFGSLIPRMIHIKRTHGAVKFTRAKAKEVGPGVYFYWPLITEVVVLATARQTLNLNTQSLTTKDGQSISVSGVVVYSIRSVYDAIVKNFDHDDTLGDVAQLAIAEVVFNSTYDDLLEAQRGGRLERELTKKARRRLKQFGFAVDRCALTDLTPSFALRMLGE